MKLEAAPLVEILAAIFNGEVLDVDDVDGPPGAITDGEKQILALLLQPVLDKRVPTAAQTLGPELSLGLAILAIFGMRLMALRRWKKKQLEDEEAGIRRQATPARGKRAKRRELDVDVEDQEGDVDQEPEQLVEPEPPRPSSAAESLKRALGVEG